MKKYADLVAFLSLSKHRLSPLLVLTHDYPDPDALASAYAVWFLAREVFGIQTRIAYGGEIGRDENKEMVRRLNLPVHPLKAGDLEHHKSFALVDTQPSFENNLFPQRRRATIVIDQHAAAKKPKAEIAIIDVSAGATSVLLAREFLANNIEMPASLATALVYGILTDTLNLHRVGQSDAKEMYMVLLPKCDLAALAHIQNPSRPRRFFAEFAHGLEVATVLDGLIIAHLGHVENPDFVSQMADFLLTCRGVSWSFCTGRVHGNLHVSLRSANLSLEVVSALQMVLHGIGQGGGHGRIAGGKLSVRAPQGSAAWDKLETLLTERMAEQLRLRTDARPRPLVRAHDHH